MKNINKRLAWEELFKILIDEIFVVRTTNLIPSKFLPIVPSKYIDDDFRGGKAIIDIEENNIIYDLMSLYHSVTFCFCKMWSMFDMDEPVGLKEVEVWICQTPSISDMKTRLSIRMVYSILSNILWDIEHAILYELAETSNFNEFVENIKNPEIFFTKDQKIIVCES